MANNGILRNFDMNENSGWCRDTPKNMSSYSLQFDGVDDYVSVPDDSSLDMTDEITVALWIKPVDVVGETEELVNHLISRTTEAAFEFLSYGDVLAAYLNNNSHTIDSSCLTANEWQFVAFTYDKSLSDNNLRLFCNGELKNQNSYAQPLLVSSAPLKIGQRESGSYFDGEIDEVRIYNRALSESEINEIYGGTLIKNGLISRWAFEMGYGTIAYDTGSNEIPVVSLGTFNFEPAPSKVETTESQITTGINIINGELNSGTPTIKNQFLGMSPEEITLEGQLVDQSQYPNLGGTASATAQINDLKNMQRQDNTQPFFASYVGSEDVYMSSLDFSRDRGEKGYEYEIGLVKG